MNVLVIGGGGREHALCWKIRKSPLVDKVYCAPGNAGIAKDVKCVDIEVHELGKLMKFATDNAIDLTVVGPELPLTLGIVDLFQSNGLKIFGPSRIAAELEGSKVFSKYLMKKYNIPTAYFSTFRYLDKAKDYIASLTPPYVIKADGLAAGKGVFVCHSEQEGVDALKYIMADNAFGEAGNEVVIEEFLEGEEASYFVFTDGDNFIPLQSSQDHKAAYDGDKGPNTGGMGAYSPAPVIGTELDVKIINTIVKPTINSMKSEGRKYSGILYFGLMISGNEVKVLEYNCRFGDPEAQPLIFRIKSDLVPVMMSISNGSLSYTEIEWDDCSSVCVVMASRGYPGSYEKGYEINYPDTLNTDSSYIFHAGTKQHNGEILTNGGRVLGVTTKSKTLSKAIDLAYKLIKEIHCDNLYYRKDIGKKAFKHLVNK